MHSLIKGLAVRQMSSLQYSRTLWPICVRCRTGVQDSGMLVCSTHGDRCAVFGTGVWDLGPVVWMTQVHRCEEPGISV